VRKQARVKRSTKEHNDVEMINVAQWRRSTEKERPRYVTGRARDFSDLFSEERAVTFLGSNASFSNSNTRDTGTIRPNFQPIFSLRIHDRYFRVQFYAPTTIPIYSSLPYLTSGQIDSISILLRSAGGGACLQKLIVSLR